MWANVTKFRVFDPKNVLREEKKGLERLGGEGKGKEKEEKEKEGEGREKRVMGEKGVGMEEEMREREVWEKEWVTLRVPWHHPTPVATEDQNNNKKGKFKPSWGSEVEGEMVGVVRGNIKPLSLTPEPEELASFVSSLSAGLFFCFICLFFLCFFTFFFFVSLLFFLNAPTKTSNNSSKAVSKPWKTPNNPSPMPNTSSTP